MYTKASPTDYQQSNTASANLRRKQGNHKRPTPNAPTLCKRVVVTDASFRLDGQLPGDDVLVCAEAAQSFLIREWNRKENKQKRLSNKGICRLKVSSRLSPFGSCL